MATQKMIASAVVSFGSGDDSQHLSAEIDGRDAGLNGGRSSFYPQDDIYALVWGAVPYTLAVSAGSCQLSGRQTYESESDIIHALQPGEHTYELTLDKPASSLSAVSIAWEFGGASAAVSAGKVYADGSIGSVTITLPKQSSSPSVRWLVGRVKSISSPTAVKITPPGGWKSALPPNARIVLMVTGS